MSQSLFNGIRKVILPILLAFVVICAILNPLNDLPDASQGKPERFKNDTAMLRAGIEQVVADAEHIYVLYNSAYGVVEVYDLSGNYLYSLRLYKHLNGAFHMAVKDDTQYIQDCRNNIYVFRDGEFIEYLENDEASSVEAVIPYSQFEANTAGYVIKKGSVWYQDGESMKCIVSRPVSSAVFQNNLDKLFGILLIATVACWVYVRKRK